MIDQTAPKPNIAGMAAAAQMMQGWLQEQIAKYDEVLTSLGEPGPMHSRLWREAKAVRDAYRAAEVYLTERLACAAREIPPSPATSPTSVQRELEQRFVRAVFGEPK